MSELEPIVKGEFPPLCVDLDALTPVNTLHERLLGLVKTAPSMFLRLPSWRLHGNAHLVQQVASRSPLDAALLPLNVPLVDWLRTEHAKGRSLTLVAGADAGAAAGLAAHLGVFDEVLSAALAGGPAEGAKRTVLLERFGERGFDYVGVAKAANVWGSARKVIVVGNSRLVERTRRTAEVEHFFTTERPALAWIKAVRVHQWAKNVLVFLPALLAHKILQPAVLLESAGAFLAFSLCASSIYLVNDLLDLTADRHHRRKRHRPFAAGTLSAGSGVAVSCALLLTSITIALLVGWPYAAVLGGYYILTWAYSLRLKRAALVDVMTLAGLYTVRIIAGAAATSIPLSFWLLAFSVFIFLSLGIVKRYTEVSEAARGGNSAIQGRSYRAADLPLLLNLGVTAGYCTVVVMALYINSADSQLLYRHSKPLWLVCPLLLYWITRIWLLTSRGQMDDDPVVFALRDRISLAVLGLLALVVVVSI